MSCWNGVVAAGFLLVSSIAGAQRTAEDERNDWPNLQRYAKANAELPPPGPNEDRVVFMGNSIFDMWAQHFPTTFPGKPYIGRGIGGQTTPQMLVRFRQDVIALKPRVVVILGSTRLRLPWRPSVEHPAQTIVALNAWIKDYASRNGVVYLDYHSAMADERLGMKTDLSIDGVHPNEAGYRLMAPLTEAAIREALRK